MAPFVLPLIASVPSIFQGIVGANQMRKGQRQLDSLVRPTYQTPDEIKENQGLAKVAYADTMMPGENRMQNRIGLGSANAYAASVEGGDPLAAVSAIQANEARAMENLGIQSANRRDAELAALTNMNATRAQFRDQEFQMNQFSPYMDKYNEGRERIGAGQQNLFSALNALSSIGQNALAMTSGKSLPTVPQVTQNAAGSAITAQNQNDAFANIGTQIGQFMQQGRQAYEQATGEKLTPESMAKLMQLAKYIKR